MKKYKDAFSSLIFIALIALSVFMFFIFPMLYDLYKAGDLNLHGIIKYIGTLILAIVLAAFIRGIAE